jgi:hypothetical protein
VSFFLEILPRQGPGGAVIGEDESERVMRSMNFDALVEAPVASLEEKIAARIIAQGAATALATDIFIGPKAVLPSAGPYIQILDTGGLPPVYVHDVAGASQDRVSFQIVVTASSYANARTRALAVYRALDGVRNTTLAA